MTFENDCAGPLSIDLSTPHDTLSNTLKQQQQQQNQGTDDLGRLRVCHNRRQTDSDPVQTQQPRTHKSSKWYPEILWVARKTTKRVSFNSFGFTHFTLFAAFVRSRLYHLLTISI